jgi:charged multivesicular body protein 5
MEQATLTTENLRNTMATVDAMNSANKEMKKTYGKIDIDKIERVQDEMEDMIEQANEVQESLGRSYGVPDEIDEDELQAELDALYVTVEKGEEESKKRFRCWHFKMLPFDSGDDLGEEETETPSYLTDGPSALPDVVNDPIKAPAQHESVSTAECKPSFACLLLSMLTTCLFPRFLRPKLCERLEASP